MRIHNKVWPLYDRLDFSYRRPIVRVPCRANAIEHQSPKIFGIARSVFFLRKTCERVTHSRVPGSYPVPFPHDIAKARFQVISDVTLLNTVGLEKILQRMRALLVEVGVEVCRLLNATSGTLHARKPFLQAAFAHLAPCVFRATPLARKKIAVLLADVLSYWLFF